MSYKLFVADDHQLVIDGIKAMVDGVKDFQFTSYANDGNEAYQKIKMISPDICIIDLDMPILNGLELVQKIRSEDDEIKLVILTMHYEKPIVEKLIRAGANGYMLKNTPREEFLSGLRIIAKGYKFYSSALTENIISPKKMQVQRDDKMKLQCKLTTREEEILILIAEGFSSKEIGNKLHISPKTVDTHRKTLIKKLEVKNIAGLIRIAIEEGFLT